MPGRELGLMMAPTNRHHPHDKTDPIKTPFDVHGNYRVEYQIVESGFDSTEYALLRVWNGRCSFPSILNLNQRSIVRSKRREAGSRKEAQMPIP